MDRRTWPLQKHHGEDIDAIAEEDPYYLRWCLENVDLDNDLYMFVREALSRRGELNE